MAGDKNPSRKVKEIDNRGAHYWIARFWAEEVATQSEDAELKAIFEKTAADLSAKEATILKDFIDCQGKAMDLGGYYHVDKDKTNKCMMPSAALNGIIEALGSS